MSSAVVVFYDDFVLFNAIILYSVASYHGFMVCYKFSKGRRLFYVQETQERTWIGPNSRSYFDLFVGSL